VVVGVEQGVVLAIVLSILDYVRRGYQPSRNLVIQTPSGHFHGRPLDSDASVRPGLLVYRFGADLFYANANGFSEDVLTLAGEPGVRWICIDAAAISDVDYSGWKTLEELHGELHERGVRLVLADLTGDVRTELDQYGVLAQLGTDAVFASVGDAVDAFDRVFSRRIDVGDENHVAVPSARGWIGFVTHDFIHDDLRLRDRVDRQTAHEQIRQNVAIALRAAIEQSITIVGSGFAHPRIHIGQVGWQERLF